MQKYKVIGVMSGTSLDGLDVAFCEFLEEKGVWTYYIHAAETYSYNEYWKKNLRGIETASALDFVRLHVDYGHYLGKTIKEFIVKYKLSPDYIASHGHTIFHQPSSNMTCQIGDGAAIAAETSFPVICDFRSVDVALGGQGAPLVPIGDSMLFSGYDFCLNLGGFANVSYDQNIKRIAYDVCPVNIVLNRIAEERGFAFDENGNIASGGTIDKAFLEELNTLGYYQMSFPKSLGKEWVIENILPIEEKFSLSLEDRLCTYCEHMAIQIANITVDRADSTMLVTGGGVFNSYLLSRIQKYSPSKIIVPDRKTIEYKEALIFGFLGVLRIRGEHNCLCSVTGASKDNVGGAVYLG